MKNIESELFSMCFSIKENKREELDFEKTIYSVYFQHDEFIYTNKQTLLLESSTGSGKTRCAPFFYAIRIILENNDKRFAIISQNNKREAKNKAKDFENFVGENVKIVTDRKDFIQLYRNNYMEKPVVAMFTPFDILFIKEQLIKEKSNLFERTRICIDEVHQRSVLIDVLIGSISQAQTSFKFGCQFLMMSATPDESIMRSFKDKQSIQCKEKNSLFNYRG